MRIFLFISVTLELGPESAITQVSGVILIKVDCVSHFYQDNPV